MAKTIVDKSGNTVFVERPKKSLGDKVKLGLWGVATLATGGIAGIGLGKELQRQKDVADLTQAMNAGKVAKKPTTTAKKKPVAKKSAKAETKKPATTEKKTR